MKPMIKPFCVVPFVEGFSGMDNNFRECCSTDPQIVSHKGQSFAEWQQDPRLQEFRQRLYQQQWLPECSACRIQENDSGASFRTAVNQAVSMDENFAVWPSRWNLKFGNVCNLACWTCNEYSSSVIAHHKQIVNLLPEGFEDPEITFQSHWRELKKDVLRSYDYHDQVTLTLLGGEPLYNKTVMNFLTELVELNLSYRTRLEFHTNGTKINTELFSFGTWNYVCVFLSLDATGPKAEWLRYGCNWNKIVDNLEFFKSVANYCEVHCTLSILNVNDLPVLDAFCKKFELPLKIMVMQDPAFMSITKWPGDPELVTSRDFLQQAGFEYYYNLIGSAPDPQAGVQLNEYIEKFSSVRKNLAEFDTKLSHALKVSAH